MPTQWSEAEQVPLGCIAPYATAAPWHQAKGAFRAPARGTFALGGKSTQKRRSNLRFENPLRALTRHLSCLSLPRERCAMQISPKYCIVYASLSAAAFALKCKAAHFSRVHGKDIIKWRPLAATYLCRFAAKARFDNRLNPRGEVSKGGGSRPLPFGRFKVGGFSRGKGNRNPFPLEWRFWLLLSLLTKVTRRRHKKKNHRRCEKTDRPAVCFFTPALISHLAVSPAAPAARPRCCRCRGCAPPGSNGSSPPPAPPPRRRRGIRPARPARG